MKTTATMPPQDPRHLFNEIGLRFTPQREAVWRLFEEHPQGLTISRAIVHLGRKKIGQATVYRTVKALQKAGFLRWVHDQSGEHRYVTARPGHSHMLVCRLCFKAVECRDCDLAVLEKLIAQQTGFAVEGHHLEFFGLCPDCA